MTNPFESLPSESDTTPHAQLDAREMGDDMSEYHGDLTPSEDSYLDASYEDRTEME